MTPNKPTRAVLAAVAEDIRTKVFTWGELRAGDCHQITGVLTLLSNGTGSWSCTTWTDHTHSGDVWHSTFNVLTAAGAGSSTWASSTARAWTTATLPPVWV